MNRRAAIAALGLCFALGLPVACPVPAFATELAPKQQALLAARVLAYDRNLKRRSNGKVAAIAILYQEGDQASESLSLDMSSAFEELTATSTIDELPVRVATLAYNGAAELDKKLLQLHPVALYVCPGMADVLSAVSTVTRRRSILTITSTGAYVKSGLSIGLLRLEERPLIVVNLPAARAEGADLDAALLRIAEVLR